MIKAITVSLFILAFAGCGGDTANDAVERGPVPSFRVESEQPDQTARAITVNIRIQGLATESQVKSAAEFVIADRRDRYQTITVNSFLPDADLTDRPFGVSRLEQGEIIHRFNRPSESVRPPTH
jgi:hypothetical protein